MTINFLLNYSQIDRLGNRFAQGDIHDFAGIAVLEMGRKGNCENRGSASEKSRLYGFLIKNPFNPRPNGLKK
jgi:hypothetical protein